MADRIDEAEDGVVFEKRYYRIGEVAKLTGVKPYVLRYWESEFRWMAPQKSRSKQRLYRKRDIDMILLIKKLLYAQRFTIAGARKQLRDMGVGTALGAYETALAYAKEREQFGKPIARFQAIQFYLAEMSTRVAAAEALTLATALAMDRGDSVSRLAAEAKLLAGEAAVFCAERGVQIHGGYGFIKDYRAEKFYRDCKICTIGEGTSEIQRLVIARQLLKS